MKLSCDGRFMAGPTIRFQTAPQAARFYMGMHPTADSAAFIVNSDGFEVVCAAGDAWR